MAIKEQLWRTLDVDPLIWGKDVKAKSLSRASKCCFEKEDKRFRWEP